MSEHGGTSLSQITVDAKINALYSTLSQTLVDKYEYLAQIGNIDKHFDSTLTCKATCCTAAAAQQQSYVLF
jgi:hypothetical protein